MKVKLSFEGETQIIDVSDNNLDLLFDSVKENQFWARHISFECEDGRRCTMLITPRLSDPTAVIYKKLLQPAKQKLAWYKRLLGLF